jgi:hypothetical protein
VVPFNQDEFNAKFRVAYSKLKEAREPIPQEKIVSVINERQAVERERSEQLETAMREIVEAYVTAPPGKEWTAFLDMVVRKSPTIMRLGGSDELQKIVTTCATIHNKLGASRPARADGIRTDDDAVDDDTKMMRLREMLNRPTSKEDLS